MPYNFSKFYEPQSSLRSLKHLPNYKIFLSKSPKPFKFQQVFVEYYMVLCMYVFKCQGGMIVFECMTAESWVLQKKSLEKAFLYIFIPRACPSSHSGFPHWSNCSTFWPELCSKSATSGRESDKEKWENAKLHVMSLWKQWVHSKLSRGLSHNLTFNKFYL